MMESNDSTAAAEAAPMDVSDPADASTTDTAIGSVEISAAVAAAPVYSPDPALSVHLYDGSLLLSAAHRSTEAQPPPVQPPPSAAGEAPPRERKFWDEEAALPGAGTLPIPGATRSVYEC